MPAILVMLAPETQGYRVLADGDGAYVFSSAEDALDFASCAFASMQDSELRWSFTALCYFGLTSPRIVVLEDLSALCRLLGTSTPRLGKRKYLDAFYSDQGAAVSSVASVLYEGGVPIGRSSPRLRGTIDARGPRIDGGPELAELADLRAEQVRLTRQLESEQQARRAAEEQVRIMQGRMVLA